MPQEACGRHRLPLKKEPIPLAGSALCRGFSHPPPQGLHQCRELPRPRPLPAWAATSNDWGMFGCKSLAISVNARQLWPATASLGARSISPFAYSFLLLPSTHVGLKSTAQETSYPIQLHLRVCFSGKATCDRTKFNSTHTIYQGYRRVNAEETQCKEKGIQR